jgi:hypothetical protein
MRRALLFACALLATAFTTALADDLPELGDVSRTTITAQQERQLGEEIMRQIRAAPQYLDDPEVTDVLVNGPGPGKVWVERAGVLRRPGVVGAQLRQDLCAVYDDWLRARLQPVDGVALVALRGTPPARRVFAATRRGIDPDHAA